VIYVNESAFDPLINAAAVARGVPVALIKAVIANESGFNPFVAVGDNGRAFGLGQMWLSTARGLGFTGTGNDLKRPEVNIPLIALYLRQQLTRYGGDTVKALSAYNAGHSMIPATGDPAAVVNPTNREYLRRGLIHLQYYAGKLDAAGARVMLKNKSWIKTGAVVGLSAGAVLLFLGVGLLLFRWTR